MLRYILTELSVIIPARNEMFLLNTIEDILKNKESDTEIIVILDGYWPDPPLPDNPLVTVIHHSKSIGQRAAVNEGARLSQSKFIMKADAHCSFGKGFDKILMEDCRYRWTMIPMLYNLHAFDWECKECGQRTYQGVEPVNCKKCSSPSHKMVMVWKPREGKGPYVSWRFDSQMQFKHWRKHCRRPEAKGDLVETLSFAGPCFLMHRKRYWQLGGCDEAHGSWGQFGTEWACKSWLSGGRLITSRKTWFAHLFRTGNFKGSGYRGSSFPYPLSSETQKRARDYSKDLWLNDKWPKAKHPLSWLINKFSPVPGWYDNT
jgi:glycosyltransferase involved in cell wall biosynthesis